MGSWAGRPWLAGLAVFAASANNVAAAPSTTATLVTPAPPAAPAADAPGAAKKPAEAYAIKLTRPLHAGDKFSFTADATVVQSLTANLSGEVRTLRPRSISVHFEGTEHVLAVNTRGEPTKAAYAVVSCTAREGKQEVPVVAPGKVVTVEAGRWRSRIDVDQGGLTIQDELLLRAVLSLPELNDASEDDCFGTDKRQKVGDSWPARPDPLFRSLAAAPGSRLKKQDVSGTMKLSGVENVDGVPCLRVQGKSKFEHFLPPATDLPENSKVLDSTFEYKFSKLVPVDPAGPCMMDSHSVNVLLKLKLDDASLGPDIVVDGKLLRTVGTKRRPLKSAPAARPATARVE